MKILSTSGLERTFKGKMKANKLIMRSLSVASNLLQGILLNWHSSNRFCSKKVCQTSKS